MRLSFGQEMRLVQKQVLAPRMIQSMEILQLPLMALQERIEQELQENPLLELRDDEPEAPEGEAAQASAIDSPDAPADTERELVVDEQANNAEDFERLVNMDEEFPDTFDDRPGVSRQRMEEDADRQHDAMANMVNRPPTLHDHLIDQLSWFELEPGARVMCERLIYALDSNGYLTTRLQDLLDPQASAADLALAERCLGIVQQMEPRGVGARNLKECLLLQVTPDLFWCDEIRTLIENHLEDLSHNRLPHIQKKTGMTLEEIHDALEELRQLNPKPGAMFVEQQAPSVTPDVYVDKTENGWKVRLEDENTPRLFISNQYRQILMGEDASPEAREYIKRKINSAQWLIESIEQRRNTLTRVSQAIVDHQTAFLEHGPERIEPLKMQQIAEKVGVHVTTISRAVDDKWIQTPRGLFPLRRFFGGGTVSADGEEVAWDAVRIKLQELIDREDKQAPYSDEELMNEMEKGGLKVARRTITKYRKAMRIPSSRQRRDWLAKGESSPAPPSENGSVEHEEE